MLLSYSLTHLHDNLISFLQFCLTAEGPSQLHFLVSIKFYRMAVDRFLFLIITLVFIQRTSSLAVPKLDSQFHPATLEYHQLDRLPLYEVNADIDTRIRTSWIRRQFGQFRDADHDTTESITVETLSLEGKGIGCNAVECRSCKAFYGCDDAIW